MTNFTDLSKKISSKNPYKVKTLSFIDHVVFYEGHELKGYNFLTKFAADRIALAMNCAYQEGYLQAEMENYQL